MNGFEWVAVSFYRVLPVVVDGYAVGKRIINGGKSKNFPPTPRPGSSFSLSLFLLFSNFFLSLKYRPTENRDFWVVESETIFDVNRNKKRERERERKVKKLSGPIDGG